MQSFILNHLDEIIAEWEVFAKTLSPASATMSSLALQDHARQMLEAIAKDIGTSQSDREQDLKSKGSGPILHGGKTAAWTHGIGRHDVGFGLQSVVAEFRALRATVLRLWVASEKPIDPRTAYEMTRFNEAIDQALAESVASYAEAVAKSRDTFLAILGNDLLLPVSAFSTVLDVFEALPGMGPTAAEALLTGKKNVTLMSGMIRDLLEYTRSSLGQGIPVAPANSNLEVICRAAIGEVSLLYPRVELRLEAGGLLNGYFDKGRMQQVIANLLSYALWNSRFGAPISLLAQGDADGFHLQVKSQGRPIVPAVLQVIFNPLVQLPLSEPRRHGSLGLGLHIAREIVRAHGGTIEVASSAAGETTLTVRLPRFAAKSTAAPLP